MSEKQFAYAYIAIVVAAVTVIVVATHWFFQMRRAEAAQLPVEEPTERVVTEPTSIVGGMSTRDGMPLDAISYDAPSWLPGCQRAYRIYDRQTGEQWWLLVMGGQYVVMPIGGAE